MSDQRQRTAGELQLRHMVERTPAAIAVFDAQMRYIAVSERFVEDYRLSPATPVSFVGRSHYEVFPEIPDHWREIHRRVLSGETLASDEDPFPRADGATDWLQWEMTPWLRGNRTVGGAILVSAFVTRQRQAAEALRISEQRYRAALKGPSIAVFEQDLDLRYTWIDKPALGYSAQELIGRTDFDLFENAEDTAALVAMKRRVIETGVGLRQEVPVRHHGDVRFFDLSVEPLHDAAGAMIGVSCAAVDITEHKRMEAALRRSESRLRVAIEAARLGVFEADIATGEATWSPEMFALIGMPPTPDGRAHTIQWMRCVHPDDVTAVDAAWRRDVAAGVLHHAVYRIRRTSDGAERWIETYGRPDGRPGQPMRMLGAAFDITERRRAEAVLRDANAELERRVAERTRALTEAGRELQVEMRRREEAQASLLQNQKLEALGQLTGGVAHDFNNVLSAVLGSFELLESRITDERLKRFVAIGERAARRAESLVKKLLTFARREQLTPVQIDPADLFQEIASLISHASGPRITRVLNVAPGTSPILADVRQLEVALLNLTVNARDAMPEGGQLTVSVRDARADEERPSGLTQGDYVVLAVEDTGTGMPPAVLARAAEPFFTTKEPGKGTGLGLAMVHGFAVQSGGALALHSRPGQGTRVEIWLPRAAARQAEAKGKDDLAETGQHGEATVLVVDDDDQVRPVTAGFLRDLGYRVIEAANAEAAEVLVHAAGRVDLLVTDVVMPGADGPALAGRLRAEWPGLPVLFVTGHSDRRQLVDEAVLAKPFTSAELGRRVLEGLGRATGNGDSLLAARLRTPELRDAYRAWRAARVPGRLPQLGDFRIGDAHAADNAFLVEVTERPEGPGFRYVSVGPALNGRLGRDLLGTEPASDDAVGSLAEGYRRCVRTGAPTYEYARYRMGDGPPTLFERLLLPLSAEGGHLTHLAGIALFADIAAPQGGAP